MNHIKFRPLYRSYKREVLQLDIYEIKPVFRIVMDEYWTQPPVANKLIHRINLGRLYARMKTLYASNDPKFPLLRNYILDIESLKDRKENSNVVNSISSDFAIVTNNIGEVEIQPKDKEKDYGTLDIVNPTEDFGHLLVKYNNIINPDYESFVVDSEESNKEKNRLRTEVNMAVCYNFDMFIFTECIAIIRNFIYDIESIRDVKSKIHFKNATTKDISLIFYYLIKELEPKRTLKQSEIATFLGENFLSENSTSQNQIGVFKKEINWIETGNSKLERKHYDSAINILQDAVNKLTSKRSGKK